MNKKFIKVTGLIIIIFGLLILGILILIKSGASNTAKLDQDIKLLENPDSIDTDTGDGPNVNTADIRSQMDIIDENKSIRGDIKIPISYSFPMLPDEYVELLKEKLIEPQEYIAMYELNDKWKVYDYSNGKFLEIYTSLITNPLYKQDGVRLFLVNELDRRFISIYKDILFENEESFLAELVKLWESSEYYQSNELLQLFSLQERKFGYDIQYRFSDLRNTTYFRTVVDGTAFVERGTWFMDYIGSPTYKLFIESHPAKDEESQKEKAQVLNRLVNNSL